jgi:transcriptional regulator with XRE-family HTH domain
MWGLSVSRKQCANRDSPPVLEQRNYSQADFESRTGISRTYLSRVENGHTVPLLSNLQTFGRVLDVPLYQLFYDGTDALSPSNPNDRTVCQD